MNTMETYGIKLRDADEYEKYVTGNNNGEFGNDIITFGIVLMIRLQSKLEDNKELKLADIIDETVKKTCNDKVFKDLGFTGNMFNFSILFILNCWDLEYSKQLKQWFYENHNFDYNHIEGC